MKTNDHDALLDAIRENFSPQAVAAIAAHLRAAFTRDDEVNRQIQWLTEQLTNLLGSRQFLWVMKTLPDALLGVGQALEKSVEFMPGITRWGATNLIWAEKRGA